MRNLKSQEVLKTSEPIVEIAPDPRGGTISMAESIANRIREQNGWVLRSEVREESHLSIGETPRNHGDLRTENGIEKTYEVFIDEAKRKITPQSLLAEVWKQVVVPSSQIAIRQVRRAVANGSSFIL